MAINFLNFDKFKKKYIPVHLKFFKKFCDVMPRGSLVLGLRCIAPPAPPVVTALVKTFFILFALHLNLVENLHERSQGANWFHAFQKGATVEKRLKNPGLKRLEIKP